MKKVIKKGLYLLLLGYSTVGLGETGEIYHGIGQVTVLSGKAMTLPFEAKVDACYVRPGQYVQKQQPLFLLEKFMLEKELHKIEIEHLELKQSLYELEKNNINVSEGALNLSQARQEAEYAKKRGKDSDKLWQAGIISEEECLWDKRRHQQALDNYKKQLIMQKHVNNQSIYHEKRLLLNKKIKISEFRLSEINKYLKNPVLISTQDALVLPVKLKSGEFYCQSSERLLSEQAIFWLSPLEHMRIELKMDQAELYHVKVGNKAEIVYPGHSMQSYDSEVLEIDAIPVPNMMPPKYRVYLKMQNAHNLRLGTQARVKVYFNS